jgi:hypothetical protein
MANSKITTDPLAGLTKPWQKFFKRFEEIEELPVLEWKELHVLAYICKRYKEHYGRQYSVAIKGAPSKSPDLYLVKRMVAMLDTTNMKTVKEYVDWVYDTKIIPQKKRIRTLAYFMSQGLGNEFYFERTERNKPTRATALPDEYQAIANALKVSVKTYGDLAFAKKAVEQSPNNKSREPYRKLFEHLKSLGFEADMLKGIK